MNDDKIETLSELGLNEREQAFVEYYVELGGRRGAGLKAALAAGYAESGAATQACVLLRRPRILRALKWLANTRARAGVILGFDTLIELAEEGPGPTRLKAAVELIDRGGMMLVRQSEMNFNINDTRSTQDILASIKAMADKLGMKLDPAVIDGQFTDITPAPGEKRGRKPYKQKLVPGRVQDAEKIKKKLAITNFLDTPVDDDAGWDVEADDDDD